MGRINVTYQIFAELQSSNNTSQSLSLCISAFWDLQLGVLRYTFGFCVALLGSALHFWGLCCTFGVCVALLGSVLGPGGSKQVQDSESDSERLVQLGVDILAEGAIALSVTLSGGALFAS